MVERHVVPAVRRHRRLVDLDVDLAHPVHVRVALDLRVVDEVVQRSQPDLAAEHDLAALVVEDLADCLKAV